jgi:hypothetical protein
MASSQTNPDRASPAPTSGSALSRTVAIPSRNVCTTTPAPRAPVAACPSAGSRRTKCAA